MPHWSVLALAWYALLSTVSAGLYALDKARAVRNGRTPPPRAPRSRIPERTLHLADLLGGWPGGLLARRAFRHKTDPRAKARFVWISRAIVAIHIAGWALALAMALRAGA